MILSTKGNSSGPDFGLGLATPITLEKLFFGLVWPSWRFPFLRAAVRHSDFTRLCVISSDENERGAAA